MYMPPSGLGAKADLYPLVPSLATNPGPNYVYWDHIHPTARFQQLFAEAARELIWPLEVTGISSLDGTNYIAGKNIPIGRSVDPSGQVVGSTNLTSWTDIHPFERTNTSQTLAFPQGESMEFYQLKIPTEWVWP